ncbi:MAG: transglutaminase N-terminal domain-containing protein [Alphaproteobacteria bacterium]
MDRLTIRHTTIYRYRTPVAVGEHRMMLRPRDSHDLRLIDARLVLSPPGSVRWIHDVFGNSVAIVSFDAPAAELRIESQLELERYALDAPSVEIDPEAADYPFAYSADDRSDLGRMLDRHYPDPGDVVGQWARGLVQARPTPTMALLADINAAIHSGFEYQAREEEGTQSPMDTIACGSGTCRDFAVLLAEAARSLGIGARIVTGYLVDRAQAPVSRGGDATHAWTELYLPGAGWIAYDPTNGTVGGADLIRVAVARAIEQVVPIAGSFFGEAGDYAGMSVDVSSTATPA